MYMYIVYTITYIDEGVHVVHSCTDNAIHRLLERLYGVIRLLIAIERQHYTDSVTQGVRVKVDNLQNDASNKIQF